jgi:transforming growth factor-beta-induced protein
VIMFDELDIVETLIDEPKFAIFVKALMMTGLIEKLKETGPFTIMVPSNLAFTTLPESKLIELMKPVNKENLAELIKYHVIEGKMMSDDIARFPLVRTLQGQSLRIEARDFCFKVNGANLQSRNIEVSNGVIHAINAVLFPAIATEAV